MLWRYEEPKGQFVITDGKHLYFYQPEQNQVIKSPLKNAFRGDIPLSFLLGLGNLKKGLQYDPQIQRGKPKTSCDWSPRARPAALAKILIGVSKVRPPTFSGSACAMPPAI